MVVGPASELMLSSLIVCSLALCVKAEEAIVSRLRAVERGCFGAVGKDGKGCLVAARPEAIRERYTPILPPCHRMPLCLHPTVQSTVSPFSYSSILIFVSSFS